MSKYEIVKANGTSHKKALLDILANNLKRQSNARFEWNYENCPFGKARYWLVRENDSDTYVGSATAFLREFYIDNRPAKAAVLGDFAVNKEHRILGPAISLQKTIVSQLIREDIDILYGKPNKAAKKIFDKIGYQNIGIFKNYIKILKVKYDEENYLPPKTLTKRFPSLFDLLLKILSKDFYIRCKTDIIFEHLTSFDDRFDEMWHIVRKHFPIWGNRTPKFLNWRYSQSPLHQYRIFAMSENGKISGFIVYYIENNKCYVADLVSLSYQAGLNVLLARFIKYLRHTKVGTVSVKYFGNDRLVKKLKQFGFIHKTNSDKEIQVMCNKPALASLVLDEKNWYFLSGDMDI